MHGGWTRRGYGDRGSRGREEGAEQVILAGWHWVVVYPTDRLDLDGTRKSGNGKGTTRLSIIGTEGIPLASVPASTIA